MSLHIDAVAPLETRLSAFSGRKLARDWSTPAAVTEWPTLKGVVTIVFTSRVGSTFLCQEIERNFRAKDITEAFNRPPLDEIVKRHKLAGRHEALARKINVASEAGWFVSKAGVPGILTAEHMGFFDEYRPICNFMFLLRRDLIGQAISLSSAKLSGQFHSNQAVVQQIGDDDFDGEVATKSVRNIVEGCQALFSYLQKSGWPTRLLFYEDFVSGDFTDVFRTFDALGVPRRSVPTAFDRPAVEKLNKSYAATWRRRMEELPEVRDYLAVYADLIAQVEADIRKVGGDIFTPAAADHDETISAEGQDDVTEKGIADDKTKPPALSPEEREAKKAARDQVRAHRARIKEITRLRADLLIEYRELKAKLQEAVE